MHRLVSTIIFLALLAALPLRAEPWLRQPALSRDLIAFTYAGDLWVSSREGGDARRLTAGAGVEIDAAFSPDGRWLAFTGNYEGNYDAYLVPVAGGVPRRLTWHPGVDRVQGWTADGKGVLFVSGRTLFGRMYSMPLTGGLPTEIQLPRVAQGSLSPDGTRVAYVPYWNRTANPEGYFAWKRYRGGRTSPIWIARVSDSAVEKVPRENSNDSDAMWIGDRLYFLSDRNGASTLFSYDLESHQVALALANDGPDIVAASAGPGGIVYEQFGKIHLFDLASGRAKPVEVRVEGDLAAVRPHYAKVGEHILNAALSPTGVRAVFEARGEILTVPAEKGDVRNLTRTSGVAERDPAWSPDGQKIAWFSDESGEYALHVADQTGAGEVKKIPLGDPPSYFYAPRWSPDGTKIAYTDKRLNYWYVDVAKGKPVKVDSDRRESPFRSMEMTWSPDSRFIAYSRDLPNYMRSVTVHSLETGKSRQITDGLSDARYLAFDPGGKYLYFAASTDIGPTVGWIDLSSVQRPVSRSVYVAVLDKDLPSPLAPESDEEKAAEKDGKDGKDGKDEKDGKDGEASKPAPVKIDFDGIGQRILALPIPAAQLHGTGRGQGGCRLPVGERAGPGLRLRGLRPPPVRPRDPEDREADGRGTAAVRRLPGRREDARPPGACLEHRSHGYPGRNPEARRGRLGGRQAGDPGRPPGRVAPDVPRGLAHRARLLLRPRPPRGGPGLGGQDAMSRSWTASATART